MSNQNHPVGEIADALSIAVGLYDILPDGEMREELETTIFGLIKSLRISAFHSSEKR
jgi:hypothetical protein